MMHSSMSLLRSRALMTRFTRAYRSIDGEFGGGGRSSVSGLKVAVFGATGFLGRYVCNELGEVGTEVYIGNRGCEMETRHLKLMFDHGNAAYYFYNAKDPESIAKIVKGANVVVNLVGKRYETKHLIPTDSNGKFDPFGSRVNASYEDVNVGVATAIAKAAAAEPSVERLVHVSCLGASPDSPSIQLRTKFAGEEAVKAIFPDATIIRPATLFGHEDWFLNWYAWMGERLRVPLVEDGSALVQPIWAGDVAQAVMKAVEDEEEEFQGKTIELAGPVEYSRAEIAQFVQDITKQQTAIVPVPKPVLTAAAHAISQLSDPFLTVDEVELMDLDLVCNEAAASAAGVLTAKDLGIDPTPLEKIAFQYLHRYREGGHFIDAAGYH